MSIYRNILINSATYAALVLGAGFICGLVRVPILQPALGDRHAQLLEMPVMLYAMWVSAKYVVENLEQPESFNRARAPNRPRRGQGLLRIGFLSLAIVLAAEMGGYFWLHREHRGVFDWVTDRDPVAGSVFFLALAVYPFLPFLAAERTA